MTITPIAARRNERRDTTRLWFDGGETIEAYVRGAVAWPMTLDPDTNRVYGYALVCAQDVKTGVITVQEETRVECIDHIITSDGQVKHRGIAPWLNQAWTRYYCDTWFVNADLQTHGKWLLRIMESENVEPKPLWTEILWTNQQDVELAIYERGSQGKFQGIRGGELDKAMVNHRAGLPEKPAAPVWALMTAIAGYDRWPWWDPDKEQREENPVPIRLTRRQRWGGKIETDEGENLI